MLREQLRSAGVNVDDRTKMWNADDGRKGMIGAAQPITGGGGISDDELNRMLADREEARRVKDYGKADEVRAPQSSETKPPSLGTIPSLCANRCLCARGRFATS